MKTNFKILFLMGMFMVSVSTVFAQNQTEIELRTTGGLEEPEGGRSLNVYVPTAYLEGTAIIIEFPSSTSSQVVITDSQTNTVVYSGAFGVASSQVIPLSSLSAGVYVLSIYAFGVWWEGEFEIE